VRSPLAAPNASSISASSVSCTIVCTNARIASSPCKSASNCSRGITVVVISFVGRIMVFSFMGGFWLKHLTTYHDPSFC
jgi:hypothetical protein